jgi:preprotein translocase subunit YajC
MVKNVEDASSSGGKSIGADAPWITLVGGRDMLHVFCMLSIAFAFMSSSLAAAPEPEGQAMSEVSGAYNAGSALSGNGPRPQEEQEQSASSVQAPVEQQDGDEIVLTTGKTLGHVQVLRTTPSGYVVQLIKGVTLDVPRAMVMRVNYDEREPEGTADAPVKVAQQTEHEMLQGQKLAPDVARKLFTPIEAPPLQCDNQDFVKVIRELGRKMGVRITIDSYVLNIPLKDRLWTYHAEAGKNLMTILRDDLLKEFPAIELVFDYDNIRITTRKAQEAKAETRAGPTERSFDTPSAQ